LIQKEADRVAARLEQLQDSYQHLIREQLDSMESFRAFSGRTDKLEHDLNSLMREEAKLAQQKKSAIRDVERLMTQMEALITREQIMIDKASITKKIAHPPNNLMFKNRLHK
jgi:predicted nuclease with TOPRIM domain